mgnify:CR=1 FL=1
MGSDSLFFIIIAICLIMSAYFSATETAFLSLNRIRMKNMADKGNKRAALVLELEESFSFSKNFSISLKQYCKYFIFLLSNDPVCKNAWGCEGGQCFNDRYDSSGFDLW